jgi:hypothetical protein
MAGAAVLLSVPHRSDQRRRPGFGPRLGPVPAVDPTEIKKEDFSTIMEAIQANGLMVQPVGEIIVLDR